MHPITGEYRFCDTCHLVASLPPSPPCSRDLVLRLQALEAEYHAEEAQAAWTKGSCSVDSVSQVDKAEHLQLQLDGLHDEFQQLLHVCNHETQSRQELHGKLQYAESRLEKLEKPTTKAQEQARDPPVAPCMSLSQPGRLHLGEEFRKAPASRRGVDPRRAEVFNHNAVGSDLQPQLSFEFQAGLSGKDTKSNGTDVRRSSPSQDKVFVANANGQWHEVSGFSPEMCPGRGGRLGSTGLIDMNHEYRKHPSSLSGAPGDDSLRSQSSKKIRCHENSSSASMAVRRSSADLEAENEKLRAEVQRLQAVPVQAVRRSSADLEVENEKLRAEVQRLQALLSERSFALNEPHDTDVSDLDAMQQLQQEVVEARRLLEEASAENARLNEIIQSKAMDPSEEHQQTLKELKHLRFEFEVLKNQQRQVMQVDKILRAACDEDEEASEDEENPRLINRAKTTDIGVIAGKGRRGKRGFNPPPSEKERKSTRKGTADGQDGRLSVVSKTSRKSNDGSSGGTYANDVSNEADSDSSSSTPCRDLFTGRSQSEVCVSESDSSTSGPNDADTRSSRSLTCDRLDVPDAALQQDSLAMLKAIQRASQAPVLSSGDAVFDEVESDIKDIAQIIADEMCEFTADEPPCEGESDSGRRSKVASIYLTDLAKHVACASQVMGTDPDIVSDCLSALTDNVFNGLSVEGDNDKELAEELARAKDALDDIVENVQDLAQERRVKFSSAHSIRSNSKDLEIQSSSEEDGKSDKSFPESEWYDTRGSMKSDVYGTYSVKSEVSEDQESRKSSLVVDLESLEAEHHRPLCDGKDVQNQKRHSHKSSKRDSERSSREVNLPSLRSDRKQSNGSRQSTSSKGTFESFEHHGTGRRPKASKSSFASSSAYSSLTGVDTNLTGADEEFMDSEEGETDNKLALAQRRSKASARASRSHVKQDEDYRMEDDDPLVRRRKPKGQTIRFSIPAAVHEDHSAPKKRMSRRAQTQDLRNKLKYWQNREEEAPEGWIPAPANYGVHRDGTMKRVTTIRARSHTTSFDKSL